MPGLSASELSPATLFPGDTIEYYSRCFVWDRREGHRVAVVTHVDGRPEAELPIAVDTGEIIPKDMMMKRVLDRFGIPVEDEVTTWRKLRTYELRSGPFTAPARAIALKKALEDAVKTSFEAVHDVLHGVREEIVLESPPLLGSNQDSPSTRVFDLTSPPRPAAPTPDPDTHLASEESDETETLSGPVTPDVRKSIAKEGVQVKTDIGHIPNRYARAKIRHQGKDRFGARKRRDQAKCAITRSGSKVHHARTVKAVSIKQQLRSPEIKATLDNLRARRFMFPPARLVIAKVPVNKSRGPKALTLSRNAGATASPFLTLALLTSAGVSAIAFSTNAPRSLETLKLFDTKRVGLGVYTTTVIGEYCGKLTELPAIVDGQPGQAVQQNSGYTLLYNAKSTKRNYVYVDALKCGSITRFISHSCHPNAAFVEQQNRSSVKVLVKMIRNVKPGAQITVHYGKERWFRCACDTCWPEDGVDTKNEQ
ncbi:hypothetical protein BBJ28_00023856 [Nothophytophthora sp. Chile5]|nr:hypothetical protein BBJ28_00023856 [Nothophytophthora sp. Chile5]